MSDALSCAVLSWAEVDEQQVELLPSRTVLSAFDSWCFGGPGDDGGHAGDGGDGNTGGEGGYGGDGGNATAIIENPENHGFLQINIAIAEGGAGGDANGGDVDADGSDGGNGGTDNLKVNHP